MRTFMWEVLKVLTLTVIIVYGSVFTIAMIAERIAKPVKREPTEVHTYFCIRGECRLEITNE